MENNRFEFYKEAYYREADRRNSLNSEIGLLGTVLVAVISGAFVMVTTLKSDNADLNWLFFVLIVGEIGTALVAGTFLLRSYYDFFKGGRVYGYLPPLRLIEDYRLGSDEATFNTYIVDSYISITDQFTDNNDHKSGLLTKSSKWMTGVIINAAAIATLFIGNFLLNNFNLTTTVSNGKQSNSPDAAATCPASSTASATTIYPANGRASYPTHPGTRSKNANTTQINHGR